MQSLASFLKKEMETKILKPVFCRFCGVLKVAYGDLIVMSWSAVCFILLRNNLFRVI